MNVFGNLTGFVLGWAVLTLGVCGLAIYRKFFSSKEEAPPEMFGNDTLIHHQEDVAHRLDAIDKWGKALTVVAFVYGIALAGVYFYNVWMESTRVPTN